GERGNEREHRCLGPQEASHVANVDCRRRECGIAGERTPPANDPDRRRDRQQSDGGKGGHLCPKEHIEGVVGQAFAAKTARETPTTTIAPARMPYHKSTRPTLTKSSRFMSSRITPISNARMPARENISR